MHACPVSFPGCVGPFSPPSAAWNVHACPVSFPAVWEPSPLPQQPGVMLLAASCIHLPLPCVSTSPEAIYGRSPPPAGSSHRSQIMESADRQRYSDTLQICSYGDSYPVLLGVGHVRDVQGTGVDVHLRRCEDDRDGELLLQTVVQWKVSTGRDGVGRACTNLWHNVDFLLLC